MHSVSNHGNKFMILKKKENISREQQICVFTACRRMARLQRLQQVRKVSDYIFTIPVKKILSINNPPHVRFSGESYMGGRFTMKTIFWEPIFLIEKCLGSIRRIYESASKLSQGSLGKLFQKSIIPTFFLYFFNGFQNLISVRRKN